MASHDEQSSVLYGIDIQDVQSLRRVMSATILRLNNMPRENAHRMSGVTDAEGVVVERLVTESAGSPLLRLMVDRFTSASSLAPPLVLRAAQDFVHVAIEAVRNPAARPQRELALAQELFELVPEFDSAAGRGGTKRDRATGSDATPNKRPKKASAKTQPSTPAVGSSSHHVGVNITRNLTTPVRKPGDRGIDDGTLDRDVAKLGEENPSKFVILIPCERRNKQTDVYEPTDPAYFPYRHVDGFNWNDKNDIKALNSWRNQVFARCLGKKGDARQSWTEKELEELLAIMSEHLKSPAVRNSWGLIDWEEVATQFNQGLASRTFDPTDLTAEVQYSTKPAGTRKRRGGKKSTKKEETEDAQAAEQAESDVNADGMMMVIAKSRPIGESRVPILRSATGIKTTLLRFTDPRIVKLVSDAQAISRMGGMSASQMAGDGGEVADTSLVNESEEGASVPSESTAITSVVGVSRFGQTLHSNERFGHRRLGTRGEDTIIEDLELPEAPAVGEFIHNMFGMNKSDDDKEGEVRENTKK